MANIENGLLTGEQRVIVADTGGTFLYWSGDTQYLSDSGSSTTTVTIPNHDVEFTAIYQTDITNFDITLTTNGQSGNNNVSIMLLYSETKPTLQVDWGDGTVDDFDTTFKKKKGMYVYYIDHTYTVADTYNVSFTPPNSEGYLIDAWSNCATSITIPTIAGVQDFYYQSTTTNSITGLDLIETLTYIDIQETSISSISLPDTVDNLYIIDCQLSSIDLSQMTLLERLSLPDNNLTTLDISNNSLLERLLIHNNELSVSVINDILDDLIAFNNTSGIYFDSRNQTPTANPDTGKLTSLDAIWITVSADGYSGD